MNTEIVSYKKFGKCVRIFDDNVEAYVTVDIGPRIIKFNCIGMENMFFNDNEIERELDVSSLFGEGAKWHTYGGHRMWVTPEAMPETYYPDCEPVEYEIGENSVTFTPPAQRENNVQHKLEVGLQDGKLTVKHYLTNPDDKTRVGGIWGITVTDRDGIAIMKQPARNTALLPDRKLIFWPYTKMNDERLLLGEDFIAVKQDRKLGPAKIGFNNFEGRIYCFNYDQLMTKSYTPDYENGAYPDFGVSSEIYTNQDILEVETLGHIGEIKKGETVTHTEVWTVAPCDVKPSLCEKEIADALAKMGY